MSRFAVGDFVWVDHHGKHRALVLEALENHAVIIYATGSRYPHLEHVPVIQQSVLSKWLKLTKDTYFYRNNCLPIRFEKLGRREQNVRIMLLREIIDMCRPEINAYQSMRTVDLDETYEVFRTRKIPAKAPR